MSVVNAMSGNPGYRTTLNCKGAAQGEKALDPAGGGETLVGQQAVKAESDSEASGNPPQSGAYQKSRPAKCYESE
jgi:hypothetical protein